MHYDDAWALQKNHSTLAGSRRTSEGLEHLASEPGVTKSDLCRAWIDEELSRHFG